MAERDGKRGGSSSQISDETADSVKDAPIEGKSVRDIFNLNEIFERVLASAQEELETSLGLLFWSGLAAGLAVGLSLLARAALTAAAPSHSELVGDLIYPVGFIFVILGRYQLFTENTLTPMSLVLMRLASWRDLFRVWGIVLLANLIGAALFALLLSQTAIFDLGAAAVARSFGEHLIGATWGAAFWKGVMAGWLIAGVVWLIHAPRDALARIVLIWLLTFVQVSAQLFHSIVGSVEVLYLVFLGGSSIWAYLWHFLIPVVLGNTLGGVIFVAVLNYMQFEGKIQAPGRQLSWLQWFIGQRYHKP